MTRAPTISVAMATYNGERYLREQLASILAQTVQPAELVVSDDGSTDATLDIVAQVVGDRLPLVVLRNDHPLGVAANFERAIAACSGEFIALSDQDDRWTETRLETIASVLGVRPELDLIHSNARLVDRDGAPVGETLFDALGVTPTELRGIHRGRAIEVLLRRNLVTGATTVVRRSMAQRAMPFPEGWIHDEWLGIITSLTGHLDVVDSELIDYRQHGGNQIGAGSLGFAGKMARLREPRDERNRRLAANWQTLAQRAPELVPPISADDLRRVQAKAAHERWREVLPPSRIARVLPVLTAVLAGRYERYSRGMPDVLRDLVQPAGSATD